MKRQPIITDCLSGDIKIGEILTDVPTAEKTTGTLFNILGSDQALV